MLARLVAKRADEILVTKLFDLKACSWSKRHLARNQLNRLFGNLARLSLKFKRLKRRNL